MTLRRAAFARCFGTPALPRPDQALGVEPEPEAPSRAPPHFAARITFPDPIGLRGDIEAGIDRLLSALCLRRGHRSGTPASRSALPAPPTRPAAFDRCFG